MSMLNFKESQLAKVKAGQKAVLTSDLYGDEVEFHGTVIDFRWNRFSICLNSAIEKGVVLAR